MSACFWQAKSCLSDSFVSLIPCSFPCRPAGVLRSWCIFVDGPQVVSPKRADDPEEIGKVGLGVHQSHHNPYLHSLIS